MFILFDGGDRGAFKTTFPTWEPRRWLILNDGEGRVVSLPSEDWRPGVMLQTGTGMWSEMVLRQTPDIYGRPWSAVLSVRALSRLTGWSGLLTPGGSFSGRVTRATLLIL